MKIKKIFKGMMLTLVCVTTAVALNAAIGNYSVSGTVSSDEGENLAGVVVRCRTNSQIKPVTTLGNGNYTITGLRAKDVLVYELNGFNTEEREVQSSSFTQIINVEMTASSLSFR